MRPGPDRKEGGVGGSGVVGPAERDGADRGKRLRQAVNGLRGGRQAGRVHRGGVQRGSGQAGVGGWGEQRQAVDARPGKRQSRRPEGASGSAVGGVQGGLGEAIEAGRV